jgi:hypothetical protein
VLTTNVLDFKASGAVLVHRLPQATGMRGQWCGDRQSDGGYGAHEQQNEQHSGGQTVHDWFGSSKLLCKRIGYGRAAAQVFEGYVDCSRYRLENTWSFEAA